MNIVLTGASRGIGYEIARELCRRGVKNLVLISRNKMALKKLKEECILINNDVHIIIEAKDITILSKEPNKFISSLPFDYCNGIINNAGLLVNELFEDLTDDSIKNMVEVNLLAPAKLIRVMLPLLKKAEFAHVVNIGSMGGYQGSSKYPGLSFYSASKAGIASLTECLAEEYKETNIRFNCLALGAVQTEMLNKAFPGYKAPFTAAEMASYIADFTLNGYKFYNGKILPVTISNP